MSALPELDGVITADEVHDTATHLASLQLDTGHDPVVRRAGTATRGTTSSRRWPSTSPATTPRPSGPTSGSSTSSCPTAAGTRTTPTTVRSKTTRSTPTCAPTSPPACTTTTAAPGTAASPRTSGPRSRAALEFVLSLRRPDGVPLWAVELDAAPVELRAAHRHVEHPALAALRRRPRRGARHAPAGRGWTAADRMVEVIRTRPHAFEPKTRWAMDWYYPVLTGALVGEEAKARLAEGWDVFAMEGSASAASATSRG